MNSAQRRQARREFPHVVAIKAAPDERYFEHDHRVSVARTWCRKQFGKGNFQSQTDWDHTDFKFTKEKDAMYFALKWA